MIEDSSSSYTVPSLSLGKYVVISGLDIPSAKECDNDMSNNVVKANKNNDQTREDSHLIFFWLNVSDEASERGRRKNTHTQGICKPIAGFFLLSLYSNNSDDNDLCQETSKCDFCTISINKAIAGKTDIYYISLLELILAQ